MFLILLPASMDFQFIYFQDSKTNSQSYIDLGLHCNDVCKALDRGLSGRRLDELSQPTLGAIEQLTT